MRILTVAIILFLTTLSLSACGQDLVTPTRTVEPTKSTASSPVTASTRQEETAPTPTATVESTAPAAGIEENEPESELAERQFPGAPIFQDEGGPVRITGVVTYTNPFFNVGVAEPVIILEDQAGFVDRDRSFLMPVASQTLGQITSDFLESPFSYSIALPIEPQGTYRDVDNDGEEDQGVQIFAIAYWNNVFGDSFLEERDLSGGGWSTAYASTRTSDDADTEREIIGGKLLIYSPDGNQGFPSGFGDDGLLFTDDDPVVQIPAGFTVVNLDSETFVFNRSRHQEIDLIEPEQTALVDLSNLGYSDAFDDLVDILRDEYAFTDFKNIGWDSLHEEFYPRFEQAEAARSSLAYRRALRDFSWRIPDGHVSGPQVFEDLQQNAAGGLGFSLAELDDGRIVVDFLSEGSPAEEAGIVLGAEIFALNGVNIQQVIEETTAYTAPFSTAHVERLQKIRFASRFPVGETVVVTFQNPAEAVQEAALTTTLELESLLTASFEETLDGFEQPIEYDLLEDSGFGYVKIYSFHDNDLLTIQLWERLMQELNEAAVPGLILDLRQNSGGRGFLADQMAAYFFREPLVLGNIGYWDEDRREFFFDSELEQRFYLPDEELIYDGEIVVIVGPSCASACEFFAYDLTLDDRTTVIGRYPTAGLGGSIERIKMPENEFFTFTKGRAVDAEGSIHIEGRGVVPDIVVPIDQEALLSPNDVILEAAKEVLSRNLYGDIQDGGQIAIGDTIQDSVNPGTKIRYSLELKTGDILSIHLSSTDFEPNLAIYDEDANILVSTRGLTLASVTDIEAPFDFTILVEVFTPDESAGGSFTLTILDEG